MTKPRENLIGMQFGLLTVIKQAEDHIDSTGKHKTKWHCRCECGNELDVIASNLKRGNTKSCGCTRGECNKTHGCRHTRLYGIWTNMKSRCYDACNESYRRYGARGITMCDTWKDSFPAFMNWALKNGYSDTLTIDRIDDNGIYSPENCRWTDAKTQANNRRSSRYVTVDGRSQSLAAWADELNVSRSLFHARAKYHNTTVDEQVAIIFNRNRNIA